jgi:hypothetical protein
MQTKQTLEQSLTGKTVESVWLSPAKDFIAFVCINEATVVWQAEGD